MEFARLPCGQTRKILDEFKDYVGNSERVLSIIKDRDSPIVEIHTLIDGNMHYQSICMVKSDWEHIGREMGWLK